MIKFLIKIANELDKRFLSKEADIVDRVLHRVFALDKDNKPKLRLLPPLEGDNETPDIQNDSSRMSSPKPPSTTSSPPPPTSVSSPPPPTSVSASSLPTNVSVASDPVTISIELN